MPIMVGCASIGLFGRALFPDFESPDQLYPHMADLYLGVGLKGVVVAGIVAAAISTFDSMGSSLSALFTRDIYARLIVPDRDDAHYVKVSRLATVVILALGFAYLPFIGSKETMLQAFLTLIPVFVTPLFTDLPDRNLYSSPRQSRNRRDLGGCLLWRDRPVRS